MNIYDDKKLKLLKEAWDKFEEELDEKNIWYHGDPNKREHFCDQKMDRIPFIEDPNANGPGIYFTKDYTQARGYAEPDGYVYTTRIDPSHGYVIHEEDEASDHRDFLFKLLKKAQSYDPEQVYYAVTDYGHEIMNVEDVKDVHLKNIIKGWDGQNLIGAAVMSYKEFFNREANVWVNAMKDLGILGYIQKQPETDHFIVYNCEAIDILKEEKYKEEIDEARQIRIFRAQPSNTNVIRKNDYVTLSVKFAVEHAENNHIYEDEPHAVVTAVVNKDDIREASNYGEYLSNKDIEGEQIYISKGYEYEGWEEARNDPNLRKFIRSI